MSTEPTIVGWGVLLEGHQFDVEDWEDALKNPHDPWTERRDLGLVLRSSILDAGPTSDAVYERSRGLLELLNGAFKASHRTLPVSSGGIIEIMSDGTLKRHAVVGGAQLMGRSKSKATAVTLGQNGIELPPPPPQESLPQRWFKVAESDAVLADLLIYHSRSDDWFDVYKAIECIMMRFFHGKEALFFASGWAPKSELELLKRTANNERHARLKNRPPPIPMELRTAQRILVGLVQRAFQEAEQQAQAGGATP